MRTTHDAKAYQCIKNISFSNIAKWRHEFYKTSAVIFRSLHESKNNQDLDHVGARRKVLRHYSEKYRTALNEYTKRLEKKGNREMASERKYCRRLERILELCQIVFFGDETDPLGIVLLDWLNTRDKSLYKYDLQGVFNCGSPSQHHDFWPLIYKFILRRKIDKLLEFIAIAKTRIQLASDQDALDLLAQLASSVPNLPNEKSEVPVFLRYKWDYWQWKTEAERQIQQYTASHFGKTRQHANLEKAVNLLIGNAYTILDTADDATEAVIAMLAFTNPAANKDDVHALAREFSKLRGNRPFSEDDMSHFNILQGNISQALEPLSTIDTWPITHLIDLLSVYGDYNAVTDMPIALFSNEDEQFHSVKFRDLFVLLHARYLMHQTELRSYALSYLETCDQIGLDCLEEYIASAPSTDENVLEQILTFCRKNDLLQNQNRISRALVDKITESGDYTKAIQLLSKVKDSGLVEELSQKAIESYASTGQFCDYAAVDKDLSIIHGQKHVTFFMHIYRLCALCEARKLSDASSYLLDLLISPETPNQYSTFLFVNFAFLIQDTLVHYSMDQLLMLRQALEDVKQRSASSELQLLALYMNRVKGTDFSVGRKKDVKTLLDTFYNDVLRILKRRIDLLNS